MRIKARLSRCSKNTRVITYLLYIFLFLPVTGIVVAIAQNNDYIVANPMCLLILLSTLAFVEWIKFIIVNDHISITNIGLSIQKAHYKEEVISWDSIVSISCSEMANEDRKRNLLVTLRSGQKKLIDLDGRGESPEDVSKFINILKSSAPDNIQWE